jgi:hypothetical protein
MGVQTSDPAPSTASSVPAVRDAADVDLARARGRVAGGTEGTERLLWGETGPDEAGFELFRRAVCERDPGAWEALIARYRGLVLSWVGRHPAAHLIREDQEYWVNEAFARFWRAVSPERFCRFSSLTSLLTYLKLCTHSAVLDEARAGLPLRAGATGPPGAELHEPDSTAETEALVVGRLAARELWRLIAAALPSEAERLVVYLSFAVGLRPREIHRRHRDRFPTPADVYRARRNALDKLRRCAALRSAYA